MKNPESTYEKEVAAMSHTLLARCTNPYDIGRVQSERTKNEGRVISTIVRDRTHEETVAHFEPGFEN